MLSIIKSHCWDNEIWRSPGRQMKTKHSAKLKKKCQAFARSVIYPVKTKAFCPPPQPRLFLFFFLYISFLILLSGQTNTLLMKVIISSLEFHLMLYTAESIFYREGSSARIKCLISFTCREFRSHQQQSGIQLCIQQQFSGGSHPSAFYSHDHRRLRSVPLQTQVEFTPAAFQRYNNASSLWLLGKVYLLSDDVGLTCLKRPNYWKFTSSNWCFCSVRAFQTSKLGNHDLQYERNDSFCLHRKPVSSKCWQKLQ